MSDIGTIGLLIIICNIIFSYKGFEDWQFIEKYKFRVKDILIHRDYKRIISSGFLHANWTHLLFNMFSFYSFARILEQQLGSLIFSLIYFVSLIAGNLFALFIHRNHSHYSAVGASGAVSGIIFAAIALFPGIKLGLLFLPIGIPSWLFGLLYISYTLYGIKSQNDNIGHEAHLGGAILGMITAIILYPNSLLINYIPILLTLIPTLIFIILIINKPNFLLFKKPFLTKQKGYETIDDKYNNQKVMDQKEFDSLLEKINKKGIDNLTAKEKQKLDEHVKKYRE